MGKRAVVTLLGMISHSKPDYISVDGEVQKIFTDIKEKDRAVYRFSNSLSSFSKYLTQERYINTLPLLIDIFEDRDIIPIATEKAKEVQAKTLKFLKVSSLSLSNTVIIDESDYEKIFQQISEILDREEYESYVIDLTHGFRHLPILMIINLIIASIKDFDKVEHIFFAKEIVSFKKYEIIDLLEYIGLAKLSFVLQNFNSNYTVGNKLSFNNENYQDLVDSLRIISGHLLGNSIKRLIGGEKSLIVETIEKLRDLQKYDQKINAFTSYIEQITRHLEEIELLKKEEDYVRLFKLSEIMKNREYLLNSITLLNESIALFCAKKIGDVNPIVFKLIEEYRKSEEFSHYTFAHSSKMLMKKEYGFTGDYLSTDFNKSKIIKSLREQDNKELKELISEIGNLRNNLAHGNSSEEMENVKGSITLLLNRYKKLIDIPEKIVKATIKKEPKKVKKKRVIPKGIDVSKEKLSALENMFKNR